MPAKIRILILNPLAMKRKKKKEGKPDSLCCATLVIPFL